MAEERRGGTMPGRVGPDGQPFAENLDTTRFDAGLVSRIPVASGRVVTVRGSATTQHHTHTFGEVIEVE
jgi:iron complex outermembrane receptor protein